MVRMVRVVAGSVAADSAVAMMAAAMEAAVRTVVG